MAGAVSAYERLRKRYPEAGGEDYIFLPEYTNRATAARIFARQFNELLDTTGLRHDPVTDTERSVYCLRHTAICMRIILSHGKVNIFNLAKNAGTSVEQIERFYARNSDVAKDGSELKAFAGTGFTLDPCSLLTNAEVSEQLGRQVLKVPNRDQQPMCEWTPDGKAGIDSSAFLEYQKQNSRFHLDVIRDLKRPKTGPGVRRFDIGNGALLSMARRDISVLVGTSTFRIGGGGSIPISDEALVNLARLAQPRAH